MLIGIVGKPSSGKSTFFKAVTLLPVEIANRPFVTIKPNRAVGYVKVDCVDKFFGKQCNPRSGFCKSGKRFVPVELIDVAGLVPDAHKDIGKGLQFLNDLNQADALVHVVDISGSVDSRGKPVEPLSYDPLYDVEFLEKELDYWYLEILSRGWDRMAFQAAQLKREPYKEIAKQMSGVGANEEMCKALLARLGIEKPLKQWTEDDKLRLAAEIRKLTKPMIIAANKIDVPGAEKNLERAKKAFPNYIIIPVSSEAELALRQAEKSGLIDYIPGEGLFKSTGKLRPEQEQALETITKAVIGKFGSTGVQGILDTIVFDVLKYVAIYPGGVSKLEDKDGNVLPDCFLMKPGSTALDFAYKLHTDFGKNYIKAVNVKTRLPVAKDYKLKQCDVIEIYAGR